MKLNKNQNIILIIAIIFVIITSGIFYILSGGFHDNPTPGDEVPIEEHVVRSGVYSLPEGSRIEDAVNLAGGFTAEADELAVNLAKFISDEQQIYIPSVSERVDKPGGNVESINKSSDVVNINEATKDGLKSIPGIGDVIAQNIIDYREENGGFKTIEDIKNVSRIGEKTFESIKNKITVD